MSASGDRLSEILNNGLQLGSGRKAAISGTSEMPYRVLVERIEQGRTLLDQHGIVEGDQVVILSEKDTEVTSLYLTCLAHGAVAVILDPQASVSELLVLISHSDPAMIFADSEIVERTRSLTQTEEARVIQVGAEAASKRTGFGLLLRQKAQQAGTMYPGILAGCGRTDRQTTATGSGQALILFTSGTTSTPKGVSISRDALATQMELLQRRFSVNADSRIVNHLPFHHSDGLNQGPLLSFVSGAEVIRPEAVNMQSVGDMLDLVYQRKATHLITVPTVLSMIDRLSSDYDDSFSDDAFQFIESTAGPLEPGLWTRIEARFGTRVVNCYGLTETVCEAMYCGPSDDSHRIGTIGKPDGFEVRLVDEAGDDVAAEEVGELWLRGPGMFSGYFGNEAATAEVFEGDWFRTGDLATCDADGFYRIAGRRKNLIIRASTNIYPDDLKDVALTFPAVTDATVVGIPDEMLGERVEMVVTLDHTDAAKGRLDLFEHLRAGLAAEKMPNEVTVVESLPYGPSGKVELAKVREMISRQSTQGEGSTIDDKVIAEAAAAFRSSAASLSASSTEASVEGWDSLAFLEFVMRLERRFDFRMAPRDVMRIRSVGDAIGIVSGHVGDRNGPVS
ncbi:MAG: AMP-binding protein [Minwuia sp.]|nr:AMP-binding protein [Minwuia sp.]